MIATYGKELATKTRALIPPHLRGKVEPDDLVQEVYARVCRAEGCFFDRSEAEVRAYLLRTVESVIKDMVRRYDRGRRRFARERPLDGRGDDSNARPEHWLAADQTTPSGRASRNEQLGRLASALGALPDDQRRAIELHHLKCLSLAATAQAMGKSKPSTAGLLRRGLQAVRQELSGRAE